MTRAKGGRLNARLTAEIAGKVAYLRTRTRKSTTAIVIESINRYHADLQEKGATPAEILERVGFIGCADGPKDLSKRYKDHLTVSLRQKT